MKIDTLFIEKTLGFRAIVNKPKEFSNLDLSGVSIDSRTIKQGECFIAIKGDRFDGHDFIKDCYNKGCRCFIIDNIYKNKFIKDFPDCFIFGVDDVINALSKLATAYKNKILASVIAITGSSGKTTTRELIFNILAKRYNVYTARKNFNNHIGLPLSILEAPENTHLMVLEMGMNHKGEIKRLSKIAQPLCAIITNIGYAHIGNLGSLENIASAKAEIFYGINPRGFVFLNKDDKFYEYLKLKSPVNIIDFSISDIEIIENLGLNGYKLSYKNNQFIFPVIGKHNIVNLAAAFKVGEYFRVDVMDMIDVATNFNPVSGRSQIIQKDYIIINDCYNANPSSMIAALDTLKEFNGRRIAILGDMLELGKLSRELHKMVGYYLVNNNCADYVIGLGNETKYLIDEINKNNNKIITNWFENFDDLKNYIINLIKKDDIVLIKGSHGMHLDRLLEII